MCHFRVPIGLEVVSFEGGLEAVARIDSVCLLLRLRDPPDPEAVCGVVVMVREEDQETRRAHLRDLAVLVRAVFVLRR